MREDILWLFAIYRFNDPHKLRYGQFYLQHGAFRSYVAYILNNVSSRCMSLEYSSDNDILLENGQTNYLMLYNWVKGVIIVTMVTVTSKNIFKVFMIHMVSVGFSVTGKDNVLVCMHYNLRLQQQLINNATPTGICPIVYGPTTSRSIQTQHQRCRLVLFYSLNVWRIAFLKWFYCQKRIKLCHQFKR